MGYTEYPESSQNRIDYTDWTAHSMSLWALGGNISTTYLDQWVKMD